MKKLNLFLLLTFVSYCALAGIEPRFMKKSSQDRKEPSYFKGGNIKPKKGTLYVNSEDGITWDSQEAYKISYDTMGNVISEVYYDSVTNEPTRKLEWAFDKYNYQSLWRRSNYENGAWKELDANLTTRTYDQNGKLTGSVSKYVTMGTDTMSSWRFTVNYPPDSMVILYYETDTEGNEVNDYVEVFSGKTGENNYNRYVSGEPGGQWDVILTNLDFYQLSIEKEIYYLNYGDYFSVEENMYGRITGEHSDILHRMTYEIKVGVIYQPDFRETERLDSRNNPVEYKYEYDYNPLTSQFESVDREWYTYVYENDNMVSVTLEYEDMGFTGYEEKRVFSDFVDMTSVSSPALPLQDLVIYPVPATDFIRISTSAKTAEINIRDLAGKCVLTTPGISSELDISSLEKGTYLIEVQAGGSLVRRTFVKM